MPHSRSLLRVVQSGVADLEKGPYADGPAEPARRQVTPFDVLDLLLRLDRRLLTHPGCLVILVCGLLAVINESMSPDVRFPHVVWLLPSVLFGVVTAGAVLVTSPRPVPGLRTALAGSAALACASALAMFVVWLRDFDGYASGTVCCLLGLAAGACYQRRASG